jgi:hypothetical protein
VYIIEPQNDGQAHHQEAVHHRSMGSATNRLTHFGSVVDPRKDFSDASHLKKGQGQGQDVAGIVRHQREVDLTANVSHQILAQHGKERAKEDDQHHADPERVEQSFFVSDQYGVYQMLNEIGCRDS